MNIVQYVCKFGTLTIPISSFNLQFYSSSIVLSVVMPDMIYYSEIVALVSSYFQDSPPPSAEIAIYQVKTAPDGTQTSELIATVDLTEMTHTDDPVQQGIKVITLQGSRTESWTPKSVTLTGASSQKFMDGKAVYACTPDPNLRPGDTVTINGESMIIDQISWTMADGQESMMVTQEY